MFKKTVFQFARMNEYLKRKTVLNIVIMYTNVVVAALILKIFQILYCMTKVCDWVTILDFQRFLS